MAENVPTHSIVKYESPSQRATQTAGTVATGVLIALGLAVLPIVIAFLQAGAWNRTALIALGTAVGVAALSVLTTFLVKLSQATSNNVPPSVTSLGVTPMTEGTLVHGYSSIGESDATAQVREVILMDWVKRQTPPPAS